MKDHQNRSLLNSFLFSLILTLGIFLAELIGGIFTRSLALLSDAAHVFLDVFALGISYLALRLSTLPADHRHTYGYHRLEVLAALVNGITLFAIGIGIFYEAIQRFLHPVEVKSGTMLIIALIGLTANIFVALILGHEKHQTEHARKDINLRSAYLHVLGDSISSIGVIVAAIMIRITGLAWLDPAASILIGCIILSGSYRVTREAAHILLEGTPGHIHAANVLQAISGIPGVSQVHDLHIWSICSGNVALSVHVVLNQPDPSENHTILHTISQVLHEEFGIDHSTVQLESRICQNMPCES